MKMNMMNKKYLLFLALILSIIFSSCAYNMGSTVITKPDEFTYVYEAKEAVVLKAVAAVFKEKNIGTNVRIDDKNMSVDSDYVVSDDWRTKANARIKKLNWRECEVTLLVTTEKKTKTGWEMRRLLQQSQYEMFFSVIDLKIYEEMAKVE